jgi:outer membrane protein assembly factor BamA
MIGGAVFGSEKKSYGGALGYLGRFDEDNWKVMAGGGYAKINSDFYGVGKDASSKDISVLMEQKVTFFSLQVTPKIWGVFVGLTLGYNKIDNSFDVQGLPATVPVNSKLSNESWVPGLKLQLDHRDNTFYPQHGYLTDLQMQFYNENLGSSANFDKYRVDHNQYIHLWDENVLALRAALQAALGDVPFYYLPMFGMRSDLRGFKAGKYRDKVVWDLQAEYRQRFTDHWGGVIFAGAGDVQPSVQEVTLDDLLWSEGVGLRYGLGAKNPVDFQCDVAYGDDAWSWYFGVGQAF